MNKTANYAERLRQSGLKNTKHRTAILDILERSEQPVTAEQIFLVLSEEKIPISLSTVYRVLESLALKGLVTRLTISTDNRALFELNRRGHSDYLVCLGCKKILTIDRCPLRDYEKSLEQETNFLISGHRLDIYGYCAACRDSSPTGKGANIRL